MKRLLIALLFIPFIAIGQTPTTEPYIDLSKYHNDNRLMEMIDSNFISLEKVFGIGDSTISDLRYIDMDLNYLDGHIEGRVHWNDDDKTLEVGLDQGSILQIGQEIHMRSTNKTGVLIPDGAVVYFDSAQGNRPTNAIASDNSAFSILTLGVATQDIADNAIGYVTLLGLVRGYDTRGFDPGDVLWLGSDPGSLVNVRPSAPATAVSLGVSLNSTEDGIIAVRPVVVQRAAWLSDINDRGNQPNDGLMAWDSINEYYESTDSIAVNAITYKDTYWDDIKVPMSNTKLNAAQSEPALEEMITGVFAYAFEADADSVERLNFVFQLPHNRKNATDLEAHMHWSPSTTNTGDCYWRFSYTIISIDGTFGAVTHLRIADAGDGVALKHQLAEFGVIDGSALGISSVLIGNVTRLGEAAEDTFTGVAYGLEFDLHYEIDSPGSPHEYVK